jgi:hypothetical protein
MPRCKVSSCPHDTYRNWKTCRLHSEVKTPVEDEAAIEEMLEAAEAAIKQERRSIVDHVSMNPRSTLLNY